MLAAATTPCPCPTAAHERRCARARIDGERGRLYGGLYDEGAAAVAASAPRGSVRLLNPGFTDEDATARRFALLEID
jgi:hypothetical protein